MCRSPRRERVLPRAGWQPAGHAADPPGGCPPAYTVFFTYKASNLDEESAAWIADHVVGPDGEAELTPGGPYEPRRWLVLRGATLYEFTASPVYA